MDKSLEMVEIAEMDDDELHTYFCERFTHQQYLALFRILKNNWTLDTVLSDIAAHLDPQGGDEDYVGTNIKGEKYLHKGDLGMYGYWKCLPAELRASIQESYGQVQHEQ